MEIHDSLHHLPDCTLNQQQETIIKHEDGPLLVVAGPGSGKTLTIILRALNLLLNGKAEPSEIIICTYTDKAARELQSRFMDMARKAHYEQDLSALRIGTIHSLCNKLIRRYLDSTHLSNDYEVLDEFAQRIFIFKHLPEILSRHIQPIISQRWEQNRWQIAQKLQDYFDRIMEELIDENALQDACDPFLQALAYAYKRYRKILSSHNCVSFAAQLRLAYNLLLSDPETRRLITQGIRYVFVDEYQDTNNIQEQILLALSSATGNLCVIGDEDQALYRFRGATVRNILEFSTNVPHCTTLQLTINYRSHKDIISAYDQWMKQGTWSDGKHKFRHDKKISPDQAKSYLDYPSAIALEGKDEADEAEQLADLIAYLHEQRIITDYNQVALLLPSVRLQASGRYTEVLQRRNIPYFCPRARAYFEQEEVRLLIACFATLFHYDGSDLDDLLDHNTDFQEYLQKRCLPTLLESYPTAHPLQQQLARFIEELKEWFSTIEQTGVEEHPFSLMDYLYRLLAVEPFVTFVTDEQRLYNLQIFSKLLENFQKLYQPDNLTMETWLQIRKDFFATYLRLQQFEGLNEFEDREQPFPSGHVQIMTIHQAKGLEFPVVIVGGMEKGRMGASPIDRDLSRFYQRQDQTFEPENLIPGLDMRRLYYVAFSRAERLLILTGNQRKPPHTLFRPIFNTLPRWPSVKPLLSVLEPSQPKAVPHAKHHYSFTGDLQIYEVCPRQYQFFREYQFKPAHPRDFLLGQLVHNSIEALHRSILLGKWQQLNGTSIQTIVAHVYAHLCRTHSHGPDTSLQDDAYRQVYAYFCQNQLELRHIQEAELEILVEQDDYILAGRVDLLRTYNGRQELIDFKADFRPALDAPKLIDYERQLCTYAYALEQRYHTRPDRLLLYWTREQRREDALMEIRYRPEVVAHVQQAFSAIVKRIHAKDFRIRELPRPETCCSCDMRHYCQQLGTITLSPVPKVN